MHDHTASFRHIPDMPLVIVWVVFLEQCIKPVGMAVRYLEFHDLKALRVGTVEREFASFDQCSPVGLRFGKVVVQETTVGPFETPQSALVALLRAWQRMLLQPRPHARADMRPFEWMADDEPFRRG